MQRAFALLIAGIVAAVFMAGPVGAEDQESRKLCFALLTVFLTVKPLNMPKNLNVKEMLIPAHTNRPEAQQCFFTYKDSNDVMFYLHLIMSGKKMMAIRLETESFSEFGDDFFRLMREAEKKN